VEVRYRAVLAVGGIGGTPWRLGPCRIHLLTVAGENRASEMMTCEMRVGAEPKLIVPIDAPTSVAKPFHISEIRKRMNRDNREKHLIYRGEDNAS
jgi:hypothetical protein